MVPIQEIDWSPSEEIPQIDPSDNTVVDGIVFSLTADDVIELCRADGEE